MLYCPSWLRPRDRSRSRRPHRSRPVLEVLEDRITPSLTGAGSVIDSDPAPVGFPITSITETYDPNNGDILVAADGYVNNGRFNTTQYFGIAMYTPNGTLDTKFANGQGFVTTAVPKGALFTTGMAVVIQPNGQIVVGGGLSATGSGGTWYTYGFGLARYNSDGTLDTKFGSKGFVATSAPRPSGTICLHGLAIEQVGTNYDIVAAGGQGGGNGRGLLLARYNPNGSLDTSFGGTGVIEPDSGSDYYPAFGMVVQPSDQKIVVSGMHQNSSAGTATWYLERYNTNGTLDATFGSGGIVNTSLSGAAYVPVLDSAGKFVVEGSSGSYGSGTANVIVARLNSDGSLDSSFNPSGTPGYVITPITESGFSGSNIITDGPEDGLVMQSNGLIVVGGSNDLACYHSGEGGDSGNIPGTPDSAFGTNGIVASTPYVGGSTGGADNEVAIQPVGSSYQLVTVFITNGNEGIAWWQPDTSSTPSPVLEADAPPHPVQQTLTRQQLQPVVQSAIADWQAAGASAAQVALLEHVPVSISPLPYGYLGGEVNNQVWISPNAAGWGWYAGASQPRTAVPPAAPQMDLLSVVTHEFGHVLGLGDSDNLQDVMGDTLAAGVRRLPTRGDLLGTGVQRGRGEQDVAVLLAQVLTERIQTPAPVAGSLTPVAYALTPVADAPGSPASLLMDSRKANLAVSPAGQSAALSPALVEKLFALYELNPLGTKCQV